MRGCVVLPNGIITRVCVSRPRRVLRPQPHAADSRRRLRDRTPQRRRCHPTSRHLRRP
nr:MAG TPA: hypothetical protein [Caudoviricetes sp.]